MLNTNNEIKLVECPRDAMQGWPHLIPVHEKIRYLQALLKVGFDTIDFGSFVSPKAIPQMADTKDVLKGLNISSSKSKLLAIVANVRGAQEAAVYDEISCLGFPFSLSPTFQMRNANSTIEESVGRVENIQELCLQHHKTLVLYLSMGFGNPYGDAYNEDVLLYWAGEMARRGITVISLADTVGVALPRQITAALEALIPAYPNVLFGVHLHSTAANWQQKLWAALDAGCTRFDGALKGIGGCPMAQDELVGNMNTEWMLHYFEQLGISANYNPEALRESLAIADEIFE